MAENENLSQTMRIDLIPDVPAEAVKGKRKRVVVSPPTRRHRRSGEDVSQPSKREGSLYNELLQSVYDAAIICDLSGRIVDVNVRAIEFFLYDRSELEDMTIFDVISGADESLISTLSENLENERFTLIQAYCVRKDGSFFPSEIAANKINLGKPHLCFFLRDITLRRQAEEMLRTEHSAIQNSANGIAIVDLNNIIEYVNPAVSLMWGYSDQNELKGMNIHTLLADEESTTAMLESVMSEDHAWSGELTAIRLDNSTFDIQVSAANNRNSDGESVGIVFSFADISDRKRADQAERVAERHRVMLESLGAACHHLGQPATVLLANLGIVHKRIPEDDAFVRSLIDSSIEAAETLGDILHKLNTVNEYKTTQYLERPEGTDSDDNRILDI